MRDPLPQTFLDTFARLRRRLNEIYLWQWVIASLVFLLGSLYVFILLDRLLFIPEWVRVLFFVLGFIGAFIIGPVRFYNKVYLKRSNLSLAKLIKGRMKRIGDRIQGALEIAEHHSSSSVSPALLQAALEEIGDETAKLDFKEVLPHTHFRKYLILILGLVLIGGFSFFLAPKQTSNATARYFFPLSEVQRYSAVRFGEVSSKHYVVEGQPSNLSIQLDEKSLTGQSITGNGRLEGYGAQSVVYDKGFFFTIPALVKPAQFTIQAGDAYKLISIIPRPRPRITNIQIRQELPEYLQLRERLISPRGARAEVVRGCQLKLELEASQKLKGISVSGQVPFEHAGNKAWSPEFVVEDELEVAFEITDRYGLQSFPQKRLLIDVVEDRAPNVRLLTKEHEFTLLPHETLDFEFRSDDDYGVKEILLFLQSTKRPNYSIQQLVKSGSPTASSLKADFVLNPEVLGLAPDSYSLAGVVVDYLPEREPQISSLVTLHLLSYEGHANLVKTNFTNLLDRLDEFYQGSLSQYINNQETAQEFGKDSALLMSGLQTALQSERRSLSDFNRVSQLAVELSEDAFRNSQLDRSIQLSLTILSQKLGNNYPPLIRESIEGYEQASDRSISRKDSENYFQEALTSHSQMLEQLRVLIEEMREFDRRFEASSFVHRLQSLSQNQSSRAQELLREYAEVVGKGYKELSPMHQQGIREYSGLQVKDSESLRWIEDDLRNYSAYTNKPQFESLANQIQGSKVYQAMRDTQIQLKDNHRYLAVVSTQKWADQIEAWSEALSAELSSAAATGSSAGGGGGGQQDQEGAEFMFRIMEIIREQQNLRGKTRALEQQKRLQAEGAE